MVVEGEVLKVVTSACNYRKWNQYDFRCAANPPDEVVVEAVSLVVHRNWNQ
jgi:hypothetical protein